MITKKVEDATTAELRRMLEVCPACQMDLTDHAYASFAITVASNENKVRLREFFHALKAHDWRKVKDFQEFDSLFNAAEARVLRCVSGSVVLLIIRNPEELWESSSIMDMEVLDVENGNDLDALIESNKWQKL